MTSVAGDSDVPARLFSPPARWGYAYVPPKLPEESEEYHAQPSMEEVRTVARARAEGVPRAAAAGAATAAAVLILDSTLGAFSISEAHGAAVLTVTFVNVLAAIVTFRLTRVWLRFSRVSVTGKQAVEDGSPLIPAIVAFLGFLAPYLVLPIVAFLLWRRTLYGDDDLVVDPKELAAAQARYQQAMSAWKKRIEEHDAERQRRLDAIDLWHPVALSQSARMTCAFGGTADSWTAMLATLGASLLGEGKHVAICDLSPRVAADVLCNMSRGAGFTVHESMLGGAGGAIDLLGECDWPELSSIVAEVLHAAQRDQATSRQERTEDQEVIREVAECLDADGPVTITRLRSALLAVAHTETAGSGSDGLTLHERRRLLGTFAGSSSSHAATIERVVRIERALRDMDGLAGSVSRDAIAARDGHPHAPPGVQPDLFVVGVDKQVDRLVRERSTDLLFELMLRRVQRDGAGADVLIVLGADRIDQRPLKSLLAQAEQRELTVVLLFESLKQHAIDLLGAGGAAAAFLRLGNRHEAEEASGFIGNEHMWAMVQEQFSESESLTETQGREESTSLKATIGLPTVASVSASSSTGRSYSEAFGRSTQYTRTVQRVEEQLVKPALLMGLRSEQQVTDLIYVEVLSGGRRAIFNVDCNPQRASSPRVAERPRELSAG
jgi:hypothetical protein